ncbi:MAG: NAD(P)H-binding protein [Acidiferrobacterales bacterium]
MKVALIGGTGFVGSYLVDELIAQDHQPVLLVRPGSELKVQQSDRCTLVPGDAKDSESIRRTLDGCDAAIYNVGLLREFKSKGITFDELHYQAARRTIDSASALAVRRFILMSANGVKPDGTDYQRTKYLAEQHLQATDLDFTVFRPSVIFGEPRGRMEFCTQLREEMIKLPLPAPLFFEGLLPVNAGTFMMSPIHVKDVARLFVKSLDVPETFGKTFVLCGPQTFTWKGIIRIIARASRRSKMMVPVPAFYVRIMTALFDRFEFFPITRDQLTMLLEGNTGDSRDIFAQLGVEPTPFSAETLTYLRS